MVWIRPVTFAVLTSVLTSLMTSLDARSDGADPRACDNMVPEHGSRQRSDPPPYYIQMSNNTYIPGEPITVTLSAESGESFKGFLIQARVSQMGPDFDKPVGYFIPTQGTKTICNWKVGLTHTNPDPKTSLTFEWMPPDTLRGMIQFRTTFVQSQYSYWVAQLSDVINEGQTTTSSTTTLTTTSSTTSQPTTTTTTSTESTDKEQSPTPDTEITSSVTPPTSTSPSSSQPTVGDGGGANSMTSSYLHVIVTLCLYYISG